MVMLAQYALGITPDQWTYHVGIRSRLVLRKEVVYNLKISIPTGTGKSLFLALRLSFCHLQFLILRLVNDVEPKRLRDDYRLGNMHELGRHTLVES